MSILQGTQGKIRNQARNLGILPTKEVPYLGVYRYVPWINGTNLSLQNEGVQDYIYSVLIEGTTTFQIVNNTDSVLYITGGLPERDFVKNGPEAIIGPFKGANVTLSSSSVTILARCYGYDFTTARATRGFLDTRGKSAYIEIRGLTPGDNPPLPTLRSSWIRTYDMFDLILGNPLPNPQVTNTVWYSAPLDFSGAVSTYLNVVATTNTIPNGGSNLIAYLQYTGIATGLGNWNAGGAILTTVVGTNYITNAPITLSANKPVLELFFMAGDATGCQVSYIDLWLVAEVTA